MRALLLLMLLACNGDEAPDTGRTPCEQACHVGTMRPCQEECDSQCGMSNDQCRSLCYGDCISAYDLCVERDCE